VIANQHNRAEDAPPRAWPRAGLAALAGALMLAGQAGEPARAQSRSIIRDAEIEALLRDYAVPVFRAAGLDPGAVEVVIVKDSGINAFVAGGQRIFINTGMLTEAETANEIIGVIAHETGHIAGGHLARTHAQLERASIESILTTVLGAAAIAAGSAVGNSQIGAAGAGIARGGSGFAQRSFLKYARGQEAAADQAAVRYLSETGQSAKGMLSMFERLSEETLVTLRNVDPYVLSHPLPQERVALLRRLATSSPHFNRDDPAELTLRHELMRAKLRAYLGQPQSIDRRYSDDDGLPARYARAIAAFRAADLERALSEIDALIKLQPNYPYFWELRGEALLRAQHLSEAVTALTRAVKLDPEAPLIRITLAHAMLETGDGALVEPAIGHLRRALAREKRSPFAFNKLALAYASRGDTARAELASAWEAVVGGRLDQAKHLAKRAQAKFTAGSPEWVQTDDILNIGE
jgi:predicted Zn-dependent protease